MAQQPLVKVLVVEDSLVARLLLLEILHRDPAFEVIGTAKNGVEAIQALAARRPDVVLMDIHMPEMDGFEATRIIMEKNPIPIVICSSTANLRDAVTSFRLMEAGAVACVEKPVGMQHEEFSAQSEQLCRTLKLMSEVRVVRRWPRKQSEARSGPVITSPRAAAPEIIGIGASTGGPPVLQTILMGIPRDFPMPILMVQHIAPGFLGALVQWLNQSTKFNVCEAAAGMRALPGHAYLAPDDFHLTVRSDGSMVLNKQEHQNGLRPSVNCLFHSMAEAFGPRAAGVLLTGMGKDGAAGLKAMKDRGAVTMVQDRESSVVHGMPGEALALGAATLALPPDAIALTLANLAARSSPEGVSHGI